MPGFLDELMLQEKSVINSDYYKLPEELDFLDDNLKIDYDYEKNASYLFYVESPFSLTPGFYPDVNAFVLKANPYIEKYETSDKKVDYAQTHNQIDGDTMYFFTDSIEDGGTGFSIGQKTYSGFKEYLNANMQSHFVLRMIGIDAPEIPHYSTFSFPTSMEDQYLTHVPFKIAKLNPSAYVMQSDKDSMGNKREEEESILFFKADERYLEVIGTPSKTSDLKDGLNVKVVYYNDAYNQSMAYHEEGANAQILLRRLLNDAEDLRIVLDYQTLNRKPSDFDSPYDVFSYLNYDGTLSRVAAFIKRFWDEYMGEAGYSFKGFNLPGQDSYGRQLGALYVKIPVPQLGNDQNGKIKTAWVNAAKYILYHYDTYTKALPEYSSSVIENQFGGYFSPVFKLYSYDKRAIEAIDKFNETTSSGIVSRNQLYEYLYGDTIENLKERTVILGDLVLFVPPTHIRSVSQTMHQKVPLLRGKGAAVKSMPNSRKMIELDVYFNEAEGINGRATSMSLPTGEQVVYYMNSLRTLLALFKLTPFLPIENNYINNSFDITAVSLVNITVETMPNYPKCLKAVLTLADFNYSIYMPELPESDTYNSFAQTINYPVMRWYYQKALQKGNILKNYSFQSENYIKETYGGCSALIPMDFKDSNVQFYVPDPMQLLRRLEIINQTKPVYTKEQLTDSMKSGFTRLKGIESAILSLNEKTDLLAATSAFLASEPVDLSEPILASPSKNAPPIEMQNQVPLFPVALGPDSSKKVVYPGTVRPAMYKTALSYETLGEGMDYVIPINPIDFGLDEAKVMRITQDHIGRIGDCFKNAFIKYGSIEIEETFNCTVAPNYDNSSLKWQVLIPLPAELRQNSYEVESLVRRVMTDLGLDTNNKPFVFNTSGLLCMPLDYNISLELIAPSADSPRGTVLFEPVGTFMYDYTSVSHRVLQYMCSMINADGEFVGNEDENLFEESLNEKRDIVENDSNTLKFIPYDAGKLIVEKMTVSYSNTFSNMSLKMVDGVAFQYCGGQDMQIQLSLVVSDEVTLNALMHLPELSAYYARQYRRVLNCWPLRVENELAQLFGIHEVLIENVQSETIPNQPGITRITMTLSSVDRTVRRNETLRKIDTPPVSGSTADGAKAHLNIKQYFDLKETLGRAELYPDLELPTVDELEQAGFRIYSQTAIEDKTRTFVDPDFYFNYGHALGHEIFRENFMNFFDNDALKYEYNLSDREGALSKLIIDRKHQDTRLELLNTLAERQKEYANLDTDLFSYKDLSDEVFYKLSDSQKNAYRLSDTFAQLATPFWYFGSEAKLPFREPEYEALPDSSKDEVEKRKSDILEAIERMLSKPIEEMVDIEPGIGKAHRFIDSKSVISWLEASIDNLANQLLVHPDFVTIFRMIDFDDTLDPTLYEKNKSELLTFIKGVLLASADAYSGESFFNDQILVTSPDIPNDTWKGRMFLNYGTNLLTPDGKYDFDRVMPYAKVQKSGYDEGTVPLNVHEAIEKGVSFSPFNIKLYQGKEIKEFANLPLSEDHYYFLDSYYMDLQLKGDIDAIKKHKEQLLLNPSYSGAALLRQMLMLLKCYVEKDCLISVYELARQEVSDREYIDGVVKDGTTYVEAPIDEKKRETFAPFLKLLTLVANLHTPDIEERQTILTNILRLDPESEVAKAYLKKDKVKAEDIDALEEGYKAELEVINKKKGTPEYEALIPTANKLTKLISICENHEGIQPHVLASEISNMIFLYESDTSYSEEMAHLTLEMVQEDETKMFKGRLLSLAFVLIDPSLHELVKTKQVSVLSQIMQISHTPDVKQENSYIRKFVYALGGRSALAVEKLGTIPQNYEAIARNMLYQRVCIERSNNPRHYLKDSFLDMLRYDKRGRMLRAFPTYYLFFVDEGREIGLWKLHDNFYSSNAIAEIEVTKSRKIAADTAHVVLTNLFNSYSDDDTELVEDLDQSEYNTVRYKVVDAFNALFSPRTYYEDQELQRQNMLEPNQAVIIPGARLQIRMGYGSNASNLPIVFNGQVAEVSTGEVVELVAQGDGVELLNPIQDHDDAADVQNDGQFFLSRLFNNWLKTGATPKTILGSLLIAEGTWLKKQIKNFSKGLFNNTHPYGVHHFGDIRFTSIFDQGEPVQNLFEVYSRAPYENGEDFNIGLENYYRSQEVPRISMHILDKTIWDVMHICSSAAPDYICSVVPFELRSSVFLGSGRHYYAYEYTHCESTSGNTYIAEKRKPFEQYHYYNSYSDIIQNNIVATAANIKTNAVGLYSETGWFGKVRPQQTEVLYIDHDIYPEYQKAMTVDTQLWAQGLPGVGNMFGYFSDTSDKVDAALPGAKEIAWRMTANALKNSVKDMYDGELIVIGDPTVKPYDRMVIQDFYEDMQGGAHVEAVVHSFNATSGFTTSLFADCINVVDDRYEKENDSLVRTSVFTAAAAYVPYVIGSQLLFKKNLKVISSMFSKAIITGGDKLSDMHIIQKANRFIRMLGKEPTATDTDILLNAVKIANASKPQEIVPHIKNGKNFFASGQSLVEFDKETGIHTNLKSFFKNVFVPTGNDTLFEVLTAPFNKIDEAFKAIDNADTAAKLAKMFEKNAKAIKEVDGKKITQMVSDLETGNKLDLDKEKVKALQNGINLYQSDLNQAIAKNYTLSDDFLQVLDVLVDHVHDITSEIPNIKAQADILKDFTKGARYIESVNDLDEFATSFKKCVEVCNDTDLLKAITKTNYQIKKIDDVIDVVKGFSKMESLQDIVKIVALTTGPLGIATSIIMMVGEIVLTTIIGGYATEWVERYLQNLQVIQIYPLSKRGKVMVAGINGHRGLVVGSPTENMQGEWTEFVTSLFQTKAPSSFVEAIWQTLFVTDSMRAIADKYRTDNQLPLPLSSNFDSAKLENEFQMAMDKRLTQRALQNESYILRISRYSDLEECLQKATPYLAQSSNIAAKSSLSVRTARDFVPICSNLTLSKYMDSKILVLTHDLKSEGQLMHEVNSKIYSLNYFTESSLVNAPILRPEMLIVLKMIIAKYIEEAGFHYVHDDYEERLKYGGLVITSATILDGKGYSSTGYSLKITASVDYQIYLKNALDAIKEKLSYKQTTITLFGLPKNDPVEWQVMLHLPMKEVDYLAKSKSENQGNQSELTE